MSSRPCPEHPEAPKLELVREKRPRRKTEKKQEAVLRKPKPMQTIVGRGSLESEKLPTHHEEEKNGRPVNGTTGARPARPDLLLDQNGQREPERALGPEVENRRN